MQPLFRRAGRSHDADPGLRNARALQSRPHTDAANPGAKELLVLGVAGITVSPTQIASAYRKLVLELNDPRAPTVLRPSARGT